MGLQKKSGSKLIIRNEHAVAGSLSHYLPDGIHPTWCRISSINSIPWKMMIGRLSFPLKMVPLLNFGGAWQASIPFSLYFAEHLVQVIASPGRHFISWLQIIAHLHVIKLIICIYTCLDPKMPLLPDDTTGQTRSTHPNTGGSWLLQVYINNLNIL